MSDTAQVEDSGVDYSLSAENKKRLIQFGIFVGILLILFGILVVFTLASRTAWQNGLEKQVLETLHKNGKNYTVLQADVIQSPFATSFASFTVTQDESERTSATTEHALIVRIPTLFGPMPAVYLFSEGEGRAQFVAFATLDGKARAAVEGNAKNAQIAYWAKRIPSIIGATEGEPTLDAKTAGETE